jgi:hypothetical protein
MFKADSTAAGFMRTVNGHIEDAARSISYLKGLEHQLDRAGIRNAGGRFWRSKKHMDELAKAGADPELAAKAVDEVNEFLNDYTAMSPSERRVIRRFVMPFWSFYKHTIKLMGSYPFKHPAKFTVMQRMTQLSKDMTEEMTGPVPEWLQGQVPMQTNEEGETRFLSTRGVNPFAGLLEGLSPLQGIHPFANAVIEEGTGVDSFTGKPFTDPNVVSGGFGSDNQYRIDPETGEATPVTKVTPGLTEAALGMIPQVELARDLIGGGARYSTGETITDPATGEPMFPTNPAQEIAKFFGVSTFDFNLPEWQAKTTEEQAAALEEWLRRQAP